MKKLEKLDVLMIIFAVIVCLFALVVMYGWPTGHWELGWGSVAALATFLASFTALYLAKSEERKQKKIDLLKALIDKPRVLVLTVRNKNQLKRVLEVFKQLDPQSVDQKTYKLFETLLVRLKKNVEEVDISVFYHFLPDGCKKYSEFIAYLEMAVNGCERASSEQVIKGHEADVYNHINTSLSKGLVFIGEFIQSLRSDLN